MRTTLLRAGTLACALLTSTALIAPALAQSAPPPLFNQVDSNGVDLFTGDFFFSLVEGAIGSGEGALSLVRNWSGAAGWTDNWSGVLYNVGSGGSAQTVVEFGTYSDRFTLSGSTYTPVKANGATLTATFDGYVYTAADGTEITFASKGPEEEYLITGPACQRSPNGACSVPLSIRRPNGMTYTLDWDLREVCLSFTGMFCDQGTTFARFRGATSSANYAFTINYATDTPGSGEPVPDWFVRANAQFTNLDGAPASLPTVTYDAVSSTVTDVTDIGGLVWRLTNGGTGGRLTGIRRPGAGSDTTTISYDGNGSVSSVTREGVATAYSRHISGSGGSMTVTDAESNEAIYLIDLTRQRITNVFDVLERSTTYGYDSNGRLGRIEWPEGNSVSYTYDARGNITEVRLREKDDTNDTGDDIVTSAAYPSSCSNPVICNQPESVTDARGNVTEFDYDPTHGGVTRVTGPEPSSGGTRPQTRTSYTQVTALTGQPVYLPTEISACQTQAGASGSTPAACAGDDDEVRTVIAYDSDNLRVSSTTQRAGDNSLSATSAFTYDPLGNLLTVDGPLSGTADTVRYRYNGSRQVIGAIGPDPDGGGSLKHRARRITYDHGRPTDVELGTVNSQSDGDWAAMNVLEEIEQDYDGNARPTVQRLESGGTIHALTQTSYDALGRVECVAQRMNPSQFGSLPADACTLDDEGSYGPDRIAQTSYDAGGRVIRIETGHAVSGVAADEVTTVYTENGQVSHVTDAEGNRTTYEYDGHDRLVKTRMPSPGTDNSSSTTDYEQLTLDANGNVTLRRLRDETEIAYSYDALDRLTSKDLPGSEPTVSYSYDLLSRLTGASVSGHSLSFTYDALGRQLTESSVLGTLTSQYDLAGRRTRLTYPGSTALTVGYVYNLAGEMTEIHENPDSADVGLATFSYDDRGRRISLSRGNGAVTTYDYDNVSRLTQIVQNLNGTTNDLTLDFTLNPASQIAANTRSNTGYSFTGHANGNLATAADGLNRLASIGGVNTVHDARGNLTNDTAREFVYSAENRLRADSAGASQAYDPLGRLHFTYHLFADPPSSGTYLVSDGGRFVAELDGSTAVLRRYVFGPGIDEPILWYEGSGLSGRRWFHADERGSIIAVSDSSGDLIGTRNRYDEYGNVQGSLTGRFGYTGQPFVPEFGLYYYRARIYNPALGRFMQADPIGYASGMNLYAYVGNNPINFTDPSGLEDVNLPPILVIGWNWEEWLRRFTTQTELRLLQRDLTRGDDGTSEEIGGGGGGESRQCTRLERNLQNVGEFVMNVGGSLSDAGITVSVIGGAVALGGAWHGDVPMAAAGARLIGAGGRLITTGGGIALVGGVMQAAGGRPGEAIAGAVADRMTRNLPLPEAARAWASDLISAGTQAVLPSTDLCR